MRVKHLDELYSWKQIRKLQRVHDFNPHNGFIPIALYAPGEGLTSNFFGNDNYYEWYGRKAPFYAKRLWEVARKQMAAIETEALSFDIVERSECFNTIRFKNADKVHDYCSAFRELLEKLSEQKAIRCVMGRAPARPYPWEPSKRYEEIVIADDGEYKPHMGHSPQYDNSIPDYSEVAPLVWKDVEKYFIELNEDELAFLNGADYVNKPQTPLDEELHDACRKLDIKRVEILLNSGANPNSTSGKLCYDTLISEAFISAYDLMSAKSPGVQSVYDIVELLISHGCDIDFSPYKSCAAIHDVIHCKPDFLKFILDKGADPNAISQISLYGGPKTALDHAADDIATYGEELELVELYDLIDKSGGKFFDELVPDFYDM